MRLSYTIPSIIIMILFVKSIIQAQCCGAGNPVSSANSEMSVKKRNLNISLDYRHSESNKYFEGSHVTDVDFPGKITGAGYDFLSLGIGYGITARLTAQVQIGYYIDKYEHYKSDLFPDVSANGFGDLSLSLNYAVYRNVRKGISVNPYIIVKFPVGKFDYENDGVKLPISMQPSSGSYKYTIGAFASWSPLKKFYFTTNDFFEYAQRIKSRNFDYQYGSLIYLSVAGYYRLAKPIDLGLNLAYETKGRAKSDNKPLYGTIYHQIKIIPAITIWPLRQMSVSLHADIPVWRKMEAVQMGNSWAIETKLSYNIKL